ncbi:helix-turn-helix transcriptional regulator [Flavobacteriaceae bacterium]|nr:helix-turn-helix transcriptional regulator [Flavobacteriaceae bacterium]
MQNDGYLRFNELLNNIPFISSKVLSGQLKEMQKDGLVERVQHNEVPLRVEYSLTKDAIQLKKILVDLSSWEMKTRSKDS